MLKGDEKRIDKHHVYSLWKFVLRTHKVVTFRTRRRNENLKHLA